MGTSMAEPSRRTVLGSGAIAALVAVLAPRMALADAAAVKAELDRLYADKPIVSGKVRVDMPQIAENGLVVPLNVEIESPMTETDYVRAVHVFAEANPVPHVLTYRFTPACGRAAASVRIRLAATQTVTCVAEMSDGTLHSGTADVKVTVGGCGG